MLQIKQINPRIWQLYEGSYLECNYIVKDDQGFYLIDSDLKTDLSNLKKAFSQLNFDFSKIHSVCVTHWHNDHNAGLANLQKETGCMVYCHKDERNELSNNSSSFLRKLWLFLPDWFLFVIFKGLFFGKLVFEIQNIETVDSGQTLFNELRVIHTPGHTPGHTAYYLELEDVLFAGDSLAVVNDELRPMAKIVTLDIPINKTSLLNLCDLKAKTLCPGHRDSKSDITEKEWQTFREKIQNDWHPYFG